MVQCKLPRSGFPIIGHQRIRGFPWQLKMTCWGRLCRCQPSRLIRVPLKVARFKPCCVGFFDQPWICAIHFSGVRHVSCCQSDAQSWLHKKWCGHQKPFILNSGVCEINQNLGSQKRSVVSRHLTWKQTNLSLRVFKRKPKGRQTLRLTESLLDFGRVSRVPRIPHCPCDRPSTIRALRCLSHIQVRGGLTQPFCFESLELILDGLGKETEGAARRAL